MASPKLFLDEDVAPKIAEALRQAGFDVVHALEEGRTGSVFTDEAQIKYAASQGRARFSYNRRHFEHIAAEWFREGRDHWGIVLSPRQYSLKRMKALLSKLTRFLRETEPEELRNQLRYM